MTEYNCCPECGEEDFFHVTKYWWHGWHYTDFSCDECDYYSTEVSRKLIPEFLHKLLFKITSSAKHTFWKIDDRFGYWQDLIRNPYHIIPYRNFWYNL